MDGVVTRSGNGEERYSARVHDHQTGTLGEHIHRPKARRHVGGAIRCGAQVGLAILQAHGGRIGSDGSGAGIAGGTAVLYGEGRTRHIEAGAHRATALDHLCDELTGLGHTELRVAQVQGLVIDHGVDGVGAWCGHHEVRCTVGADDDQPGALGQDVEGEISGGHRAVAVGRGCQVGEAVGEAEGATTGEGARIGQALYQAIGVHLHREGTGVRGRSYGRALLGAHGVGDGVDTHTGRGRIERRTDHPGATEGAARRARGREQDDRIGHAQLRGKPAESSVGQDHQFALIADGVVVLRNGTEASAGEGEWPCVHVRQDVHRGAENTGLGGRARDERAAVGGGCVVQLVRGSREACGQVGEGEAAELGDPHGYAGELGVEERGLHAGVGDVEGDDVAVGLAHLPHGKGRRA